MNTPAAPKAGLHPVIWVAAIAVILFSIVGIASMTGLLSGNKAPETAAPAPVAAAPAAPAAAPAPEPAKPVVAEQPAPPKPAAKVAAKPAPKPKQSASYSSKPGETANESATYSSKPAPPPPCPSCAVVSSIEPVAVEGEGTGLGAIAGGVLGAVIGNQIGGGSGRDVARIAGIAGGAYAGHQIEKSQRAHTAYDIVVRFTEDGSTQRFREDNAPVWQVGDKVRVENGRLVPR